MNLVYSDKLLKLLAATLLLTSQSLLAFNMPQANPYLADSNYAMAHADPAQQDALPQAGPGGPSKTLTPDEIQYVHTGPGFFGIATWRIRRWQARVLGQRPGPHREAGLRHARDRSRALFPRG